MEKGLRKSFLPKIAFDTFKNAQLSYSQEGSFPNEILEALHSYFDESFTQATELLEKCRITCYSIPNGFRKVYEVSSSKEQHVLFENVNFCRCDFFKLRVLDARSSLSCKHVLVLYLAKIMGKIRQEQLTESVFEEYLNMQFTGLVDEESE